jgi:hypothetical protein
LLYESFTGRFAAGFAWCDESCTCMCNALFLDSSSGNLS